MNCYFDALPNSGRVKDDVSAFLTAADKIGTLTHTRQVMLQTRLLAAQFGESPAEDMKRAALAAWCHDLAAVVPPEQVIAVAERWEVPLTDADRAVPAILHGPIAAAVVAGRLGVDDEDVLNAIRYHSTLRAGASTLEKIVFVADKLALDPTSPCADFLPDLQAAHAEGLDAMARVYLDWVLNHGPALGWTVHPHVAAAHAELSAPVAEETEG
ncbi:MAG: hypothetical protein Kow0077_08070 [Anaerolineae bacterium]